MNSEIIIILTGFTVTALTIIFNPVISSKINSFRKYMDVKLQETTEINNRQYNTIKSDVMGIKDNISKIDMELKDHNRFIANYVAERGTIQCLDFVVSDALKFVSDYDDEISNFIMYISNIMIDTFKDLMEIGVDNLTKDILVGKLKIARNKAFNNKCDFVSPDYLQKFKKYRMDSRQGEILIDQLLEISRDAVNSKKDRYRNITERFMQTLMRDAIITWNEYKINKK